jgi:hypothetical protein
LRFGLLALLLSCSQQEVSPADAGEELYLPESASALHDPPPPPPAPEPEPLGAVEVPLVAQAEQEEDDLPAEAEVAHEQIQQTEAKLDELIERLREAHPEIVEDVAEEGIKKGRSYDLRTIESSQRQLLAHDHEEQGPMDEAAAEEAAEEEDPEEEEAASDDKPLPEG